MVINRTTLRFYSDREDDVRANQILDSLPGSKQEYIVQAIIAYDQMQRGDVFSKLMDKIGDMIDDLDKRIDQKLSNISITCKESNVVEVPQKKDEKRMNKDALAFLSSL